MNTLIKSMLIPLLVSIATVTLCSQAVAATYQTYVIHTYGGDALLPAVRQQLNTSRDGGTVATYQDKLVLQTTPANYQAVQQLLTQIDRQPQALTVAVRVGNNSSAQGNIQQGRVIISNQGIQGAGVLSQNNSQQQNNSLYQVQTLSGSAASISTGTLWSLTQNYQVNVHPNYNRSSGQIIIQQRVLLPTTQGIQVTPRLLANGQVEVNLSQVEEQLVRSNLSNNRNGYSQNNDNQNNSIQSQGLNSTIIVARGQWVNIGQIEQNSQNTSSGYGSNRSLNNNNSTPIWLLVQ